MEKYPYLYSCIVNLLAVGLIALFVYKRSPDKELSKRFLLVSLSLVWWSFSLGLNILSNTKSSALLWVKSLHAGAIFIPICFLHFVGVFLNYEKRIRFIPIMYLLGWITIVLDIFTPFFVTVEYRKSFDFYVATPGPLYLLHLLTLTFCLAYIFYLLIDAYKVSHLLKKHQIIYFFIALAIGYTGGLTNYLINYNVKIPYFYPLGNYTIFIYVGIIAYTIVRHQLMNIEIIIKKTLVFASLFVIIFGVFTGITVLTQELIAGGRLLGLAISSIIIIFAVRPLEDFLIKVTDKYLFQKKYDPTQLIKTFTDEVITVMDLDRLVRTTVATLANTLNLHACAILLLNKDEDKYELQDSYGLQNKNAILNTESLFVNYLKRTNDILIYEETMPQGIKEDMKRLNAQLAIPLILHKQVIGMLVLGKKKSDQDYTKEDIDILTALAKAEAIALSNARLFTEAKQNIKLAAIGALAAGINHEVCNPLNRMMSDMQVFLKSREMGLYKDKSDKELVRMSDNIMKDAMDEIRKIASITRTLSNFAKPSREVMAEKINIADSLQDTLGVLGHEIELKRIEFIKTIKEPLFIMADRDQLQEIFFNIIRNAIQAMEEKGKLIFSAQKENDKVIINITDTGPGISEDRLHKIYNPFYTTKGEGTGTGLGLAIVRQLVTRNKGDVHVRSQIGEGTTFTLEFPRAI